MSTRSGRIRPNAAEASPPRTRKGVSPPRSPGRPRKTSPPARSASRKSPARKSPSRKSASKFPARKSPSRTTKETTETAAQKSPGKRVPLKSDVSVRLQDINKVFPANTFQGTRSRRSEYSIRDLPAATITYDLTDEQEIVNGVDSTQPNDGFGLRNRRSVEEIVPRRSGRLRDFADNVSRRSTSKSASASQSGRSISQSFTISDEENSEEELGKQKSASVKRQLATPLRESLSRSALLSSRWEFGGRIGSACLMLLIPLVVFSILLACPKQCLSKHLLELTGAKTLASWFSWQATAVVLSQLGIQAVLSYVRVLGVKADRLDDKGKIQVFNGFFCTIVTAVVLFSLKYFDVYDSNNILSDYLKLATVSYICAVILSIVLYVKSIKQKDTDYNPYGNTGYVLYDFCMGKEIHPFIKNFDIKIWVARIANINALLLAALIFQHGINVPSNISNLTTENQKEFLSKIQYKPTILVYAMMQIVYILNFIIGEHGITTTFFWNSEGLGYLQLVSSALYPFYFTTIAKFVAENNITLSTNILVAASVLYTVGLLLMKISNNIKNLFRHNPSLPNVESMPTFHGKKLLISGVWGVLRHPNYTGDILIHIALALPGILSRQFIAAAPAVITIVLLLHRAWRDHARCRRRYGAAWERYCKRVPSVVIPKVL